MDEHRKLSPEKNREVGHKNTAADGFVQSHHIIQDQWAKLNVPGYKRNDAPAILLKTASGEAHAIINARQGQRARDRTAAGLPPWKSTTILEEFRNSSGDLKAAGLTEAARKSAMLAAYRYFKGLGAL